MVNFTPKSRDIFDAFAKSGRDVAKIDLENDGRAASVLYVTLMKYANDHPEYGIVIRMCKGEVYLVRKNAGTSPSDIFK